MNTRVTIRKKKKMHILNNGNGIASEFTWMIDHPIWSIIIGVILIVLFGYILMLSDSTNSKYLKLVWFLEAVVSICIIGYFVMLVKTNDTYNQINDKICFTSSNKTLNRVYRASPDIEITSDKKAQDQQRNAKPAKQYIYFTNNKNYTDPEKQPIMQIKTKFVGKKSTISLKPLNDLGRSYDRVCWYIAKQPNLYDLKIRVNNNGTVATYRPNVDSQSKIKVVCFLNKPEKQVKKNSKTIDLSLVR